MTYNEWCEYAQFGQACEYDNQILNFVEQYNNAKHQQFINKIENDRANRQVQGVTNFWQERGDILPTDRHKTYGSDEVYTRPNYQEVHTAVLRW
jgi:hypothetical protein